MLRGASNKMDGVKSKLDDIASAVKPKHDLEYYIMNHPIKLHLMISVLLYLIILALGYYFKLENPPYMALLLLVFCWIVYFYRKSVTGLNRLFG